MIGKTLAFALLITIAFSIRSTDKVNAPPVFFLLCRECYKQQCIPGI